MGDSVSNTRRKLLGGIAAGSVTAMALAAPKGFSGTTTYQYDDLGRVVKVNHANGSATCYSYDAADNRTAVQTASTCAASSSSGGGPTIIQITSASNLRTLANNAGYTGAAPGNYQFEIASGVTVMGAAGSGRGIDTGTWPAGSTLTLVVNGNLYGGGGNGGNGGSSAASLPTAGGAGGDGVYAQAPISITVNSAGSIKGGGGGGGGGKGAGSGTNTRGGGGGGGGFPNGGGGPEGFGLLADGNPGNDGSTAGGGGGGAAVGTTSGGGNGGGAGAAGGASATTAAGGAAGYAVRKNGQTVTVSGAGAVTGTVA